MHQAHYRLGSSLAAVKRFEDAMDSFTTALELAETDEEKYDTLSQIITIGSEVEGMLYIMHNICEEKVFSVLIQHW